MILLVHTSISISICVFVEEANTVNSLKDFTGPLKFPKRIGETRSRQGLGFSVTPRSILLLRNAIRGSQRKVIYENPVNEDDLRSPHPLGLSAQWAGEFHTGQKSEQSSISSGGT